MGLMFIDCESLVIIPLVGVWPGPIEEPQVEIAGGGEPRRVRM